ncbi:AbrB/MazE/SpoVT family DNA-binding domain-containing protein [Methylobacterium oryzihabitans]|nr:AbrB/MazE/SpoVT family DNA-binding domain-containing protein [Methylobacterium oryzihabitans]
MLVQLSKWGNSLAVRLPAHALKDVGLGEGSQVDLTVEDGRLVLSPVAHRPRYTLDELLEGFKEEHVHEESFADRPRGQEIF